jgi:uncharacterized protein (DUF4415 family)
MQRYRLDPRRPRRLTRAEARRLDAAPLDYSEIPPLGEDFFRKAAAAWPPAKRQLTIRLDADVLAWVKGGGRGYQTRINRILRLAMESQYGEARRPRSTGARRLGEEATGLPPPPARARKGARSEARQ